MTLIQRLAAVSPFVALTALAAALFAALFLPAPAVAGGHTDHPRPGVACTPAGATTTIDTDAGPQTYRCEQRAGDRCAVWHWVYNPGVPKGQHTPSRCPSCPTAGPSTSPSASATPGPSVSPSSGMSTAATAPAAPTSPVVVPAGETLPRTGPGPFLFCAGLAALAAGVVLVWLGYRRRRPVTH